MGTLGPASQSHSLQFYQQEENEREKEEPALRQHPKMQQSTEGWELSPRVQGGG